jgi:xanthine dehydrogenase accessory factor
MRMLDFYIYLYDTRAGLNTFEENESAHEKKLLTDYSELKELIPSGNEYVVVMTIGYRTDDGVIRTLMDKRSTYTGVLGSRKKLEKMFADYRKEGLDEEKLSSIHAPIGIPVNSRTPEEIAISIAAQIIAVKNKSLSDE